MNSLSRGASTEGSIIYKITMFIDYKSYINSQEWIEKRNNHIKRDPICRACWSDKQITVHHISYKNLWKERKWDLMTLCWKCHKELHEWYDIDIKRRNLSSYSKWFTRVKRAEIWTGKIEIKYKRMRRKKKWTDDLMRK